jgi:replicative DNA helicase
MKRMLAAQGNVSMQAIRTGCLGPRQIQDLITGAAGISDMKIFFGNVPNMAIGDLVAESRILKAKEKIDFLIIDYIGLISVPQGEAPRWETFSMVSQRIKSLARELDIPVLALSQLRREADGKKPGLADLRETGSIEQDADLVMFMHKEEQSNDQAQKVKLIVAKQRNGSTGDIDLLFDKSRMKFSIPEATEHRQYKD